MRNLKERIDSIIVKGKLPWKRRGQSVTIRIMESERKHVVRTEVHEGRYRMYSVVLRAAEVPKRIALKRDLIYRTWRKNALKELVTFTFDESGNLIGVVESPIDSLDDEEIVMYMDALAREADRFEYKLTGQDLE